MCKVNYNEEKNGIELSFNEKPDVEVLNTIKSAGFRWHRQKKIWYAKQNEETMKIAEMFSQSNNQNLKLNHDKKEYDLWDMTVVPDDLNNRDENLSRKEIAAAIRKHIRARFPMCKFSVRSSGYKSIDIDLLESPFTKDSDELKAIVHYIHEYAYSYRYCIDYDPYGDYGSDYNFCGAYESSIVSYNYKQTEMSVSVANMCEQFQIKKAEWEEAERIREAKEMEERLKQMEADRIESERLHKIREANHKIIEDNAVVEETTFTVLNVKEANLNKNDTISEYEKECAESKYKRTHCEVTKAVRFDKKTYELFANALLDDYSFLENTGGSRSYDNRVNSMIDYRMMDSAERDTVEWISVECVAIYCEDKLMFIVDAQGYSYARYCFLLDEESTIADYHCNQVLSEEEMNGYRDIAEEVVDKSTSIIINNEFGDTWKSGGENADKYKELLKTWILDNKIQFNANVIRALDGDYAETKQVWYQLLSDIENVQEQFKRANLQKDQLVTICFINDFGMMCQWNICVDSVRYSSYAQYDKAVLLTFTMKGKRKLCSHWFYRDVVIYDGWVEIPESVLWEDLGNGMKKSKYLSCDNKNYDDIMEYLKSIGYMPIINTYKPAFA